MKKNVEGVKDLVIMQARELYESSHQVQELFPEVLSRLKGSSLENAIDQEINATKDQTEQLEKAFERIHYSPSGEVSLSYRALLDGIRELCRKGMDEEVFRAGIVNSLLHLNHARKADFEFLLIFSKDVVDEMTFDNFRDLYEKEKKFGEELFELTSENAWGKGQ